MENLQKNTRLVKLEREALNNLYFTCEECGVTHFVLVLGTHTSSCSKWELPRAKRQ